MEKEDSTKDTEKIKNMLYILHKEIEGLTQFFLKYIGTEEKIISQYSDQFEQIWKEMVSK